MIFDINQSNYNFPEDLLKTKITIHFIGFFITFEFQTNRLQFRFSILALNDDFIAFELESFSKSINELIETFMATLILTNSF